MTYEIKRMDECCISISDGDHLPPPKSDSGVPFITISNIDTTNNTIGFSNTMFVPEAYYDALQNIKKATPGDILYSVVGTFGVPVQIKTEKKFVFQRHIAILRPNKDVVLPEYLYYVMKSGSFYAQADAFAVGSAQRTIGLSSLRKMKAAIPCVEEQEKTVTVLAAYDNLIEVNNKRIKVLEQMAENLYKEWFVRFRFPGHETTEFENGIPKGWHIRRIDEIGEVVGGGTPSTEHPEYWHGDIPWLTPADLASFKDVFISNGSTFITAEGMKKSSTKLLPKDTVLLSSRAPIGYVAIAKNSICTNQGFKSVICNTNLVMPFYLFFFFKNNKELLEGYASGSTFLELSGGRLKRIKLIIPPLDIQTLFYNAVHSWLKQTDVLSQMNRNLIRQRDLLLPRLMNGKLEV